MMHKTYKTSKLVDIAHYQFYRGSLDINNADLSLDVLSRVSVAAIQY